ncbi:hypothetical protein ABZW32_32205 [Streptomyces sp. NPDC004667]|uniref:hypothetical protein n=1 Tax=Streptomyces sp. NPDC004667 TaxID=3154285 RepID=UPI0033AF2BB1
MGQVAALQLPLQPGDLHLAGPRLPALEAFHGLQPDPFPRGPPGVGRPATLRVSHGSELPELSGRRQANCTDITRSRSEAGVLCNPPVARHTHMMSSFGGLAVSGGTVRIRREEPDYSINIFCVWIDGIQVGELRNHSEISIPVTSGPHNVQLRWKQRWYNAGAKQSETVSILVESGAVIEFESRVVETQFSARIELSPEGRSIPEASSAGTRDARVLEVTHMSRIEERLGDEVRLIDNRSSSAPVTRRLTASREWTRTLTLGENHGETMRADVGANLLWIAAKGSIETELQRTLSLTIGSTHLFEEEIGVTVPERTAVRIVLSWKRIWQCGQARVLIPDGTVHIVPYQVVVSVTFDQSIQDI